MAPGGRRGGRGGGRGGGGRWGQKKQEDGWRSQKDELRALHREIQEFVKPEIDKKLRKLQEQSTLTKVHGIKTKSEKMPLPELIRYRTAQQKRVAKVVALEKETGVTLVRDELKNLELGGQTVERKKRKSRELRFQHLKMFGTPKGHEIEMPPAASSSSSSSKGPAGRRR